MNRQRSQRWNRQRGMALATVLFLSVVLSVLAATVLYSTNLETISAFNYKSSTEAFYAADGGLQAAVNWFENDYTPQNQTQYNVNATPVTSGGNPVVLDGIADQYNFPNNQIVASYKQSLKGMSLASGVAAYSVRAKLISVRRVETISGLTNVERWELDSQGSWKAGGNHPISNAMVVGYVEQQISPESNYGLFSTGAVCNSMSLGGNSSTDSYNSNIASYTAQHSTTSGGDIGSNGNISASGHVTIGGNATVPGGAGGSCSSAPIGGISPIGNVTMNGSVYTLQQQMQYDTPPVPSPWTLTSSYSGSLLPLAPGNYGNILLLSGGMTLQGGQNGTVNVYNVNSIMASAMANITINPPGPIILNIVGAPNLVWAMNLSGGAVINPSGIASNLLIQYGGTGAISMSGNSQASFIMYAPQASVTLVGTSDFYGAIIGKTVSETGAARMHYDMALRNYFVHLSPFSLLSWNRVVK